jgi:hypothetical protein
VSINECGILVGVENLPTLTRKLDKIGVLQENTTKIKYVMKCIIDRSQHSQQITIFPHYFEQ